MHSTAKGSVGIYVSPPVEAYQPNSLHSLIAKGGVVKPVRTSNWSSNTMGIYADDWLSVDTASNTADDCGYVNIVFVNPEAALRDSEGEYSAQMAGTIKLYLTLQLRGFRE
jgi:hypothetical protein